MRKTLYIDTFLFELPEDFEGTQHDALKLLLEYVISKPVEIKAEFKPASELWPASKADPKVIEDYLNLPVDQKIAWAFAFMDLDS